MALLRYAIHGSSEHDPGCSAGQMMIARSSKAMRSRWRLGASMGDVVVAAAEVLHECITDGENPRRAVRFTPRIGRSRAFSRPWSASIGLFAYCSAVCRAEGINSSRTRG